MEEDTAVLMEEEREVVGIAVVLDVDTGEVIPP